jgi:hypothetical protein
MFWQDIFVSEIFPRAKVISAFSKVFGVNEKMIKLIKDIEEMTDNDGSSIICQSYKSNTDFPLRLSIYITDEKIVPLDEQGAVSHISRELGCDVLMSDESTNPYSMLSIGKDGIINQVSVDIEKYDDAEEFELQ